MFGLANAGCNSPMSYSLVNFVVHSQLLDMPRNGIPRVLGLQVLDFLFSLLHIYNTRSQNNWKSSFFDLLGTRLLLLREGYGWQHLTFSPVKPLTPLIAQEPAYTSCHYCCIDEASCFVPCQCVPRLYPPVNWPDFPTSFGHYEAKFCRMLCSPVMKGAI